MALSKAIVDKIIRQTILVKDLSNQQLAQFCEMANLAYRSGKPIISDQEYDFVYLAALSRIDLDHQLLNLVEPEGDVFFEEKILLPEPMLSTDKAYSWYEVKQWIERLEKSANEIGLDFNTVQIKVTPKLDGFAGYDDGVRLYTRGDGKKGSDISRVFERGLQVWSSVKDTSKMDLRGQGAGEIVVKKSYFKIHLSDSFESPRNFQASLIKEKALDERASQAINVKAAVFVPFTQLPTWQGNKDKLTKQFDIVVAKMLTAVDFDVDGVIFEVVDDALKAHMGANRKFHRWQIAFKENKDQAQVKVVAVTPQVGRTGKITPVATLQPILLSGATIVHATGHHYGLVKQQGLGAGSVVELIRSGLVIPKINKVLKVAAVNIPNVCPSCAQPLQWEADFLMCINHDDCPDQVMAKMAYFFQILANNDGFGMATIEKLYRHGIRKVSQIYALTESNLKEMGFGDRTSVNLIAQLKRSTNESIEDWRFLAAFGINRMGMGNCENLLKSFTISDIFFLSVNKVANINGFAQITAQLVIDGLFSIIDEFKRLSVYEFNLEKTHLRDNLAISKHEFFDKKIVFTGKMNTSREVMTKQAKSIGIQVMLSVNKATNYLVIGKKVGHSKIISAQKYAVEVITEADYLARLSVK